MLLIYARLSTELLGYQPHETRSLLRLDSTNREGMPRQSRHPLHLLGWRSPGVRGGPGLRALMDRLRVRALNVQYGQLFLLCRVHQRQAAKGCDWGAPTEADAEARQSVDRGINVIVLVLAKAARRRL
jgi:hypothetical protein